MLKTSLIFGAMAIMATLAAAPFLGTSGGPGVYQLDTVATGSVVGDKTYTLRKSVLQATPASVCVIRGDTASGDC